LSISSFEGIQSTALNLKMDFSIGLICPDQETITAVHRARDVNFGNYIVIGPKKIPGLEFLSAANAEIAADMAINLACENKCDFLVKGNINTHILLKKLIRSPMRSGWVSHVSVLELPSMEKLLIVSDGTVTPEPTVQQKVMIASNAINFAVQLGIEKPKVAVVAANELVLDSLRSTKEAAEVVKLLQDSGLGEKALIGGPVPLDVALSSSAVVKKRVHIPFDPPADVLVCDNLEAAAAVVKTAAHLAHLGVAGVLLGTSKPVALTSRSDNWKARLTSIYLCAILAARREKASNDPGLYVG